MTKVSLQMVYTFILHLLGYNILSGLPSSFKILPLVKNSLVDFGMYSTNQIATKSPWAITNFPLCLDISIGFKPKFYNKEEETAFMLLKDEKLLSIIVEIILDNLDGMNAIAKAKLLYKLANDRATILGQYGQTLTRAAKALKASKSITPTKPERATTKRK